MKLGLDVGRYRSLPCDKKEEVSAWVTRHGFPRSVEYHVVGEGVVDVLCYVFDPERSSTAVPIQWGDHGLTCLMVWRRGLLVPEPPPVVVNLEEISRKG